MRHVSCFRSLLGLGLMAFCLIGSAGCGGSGPDTSQPAADDSKALQDREKLIKEQMSKMPPPQSAPAKRP